MNHRHFLLVLYATGLSGCAFASPPQSSGLIVTPVSSEVVGVLQPKLVSKQGQLELVGSVYKKVGGASTGTTHLDVLFLDSAGSTLAVKTVQFEPRVIRHARPPAGRGHYASPVGELPPGTATLEVRAHDGEHPQS
jgi:hypothetical protein